MSRPPPSPASFADQAAAAEQALLQAGLPAAAAELRAVRDVVYTTSSEWLGELGLAASRILAMRGVPRDLRGLVTRLRKAARAALRW